MTETGYRSGDSLPSSDIRRAGDVGRVLFVANVDTHLWAFHLPYMDLLRDMGYTVEAAAAPAGFAEKIFSEGYEVHPIPFTRHPLSFRNIMAYRELCRLLRSRRYTMVHVHTPVAGFLGRLAARRQEVPHILYTAHGFHFHSYGRRWANTLYYMLERMAVPWTDVLITINKEDFSIASRAFAHSGTRILYVPGVGTDCRTFTPVSAGEKERERIRLHLAGAAVVIAWVAEFIPRKRPVDIITAVDGLGSPERMQLVMLGDGPLLESVRNMVLRRSGKSAVLCPGRVANVGEYLAASDIFVSTASQEGLPRNVMEAMAAGLPVVAYDIRGCNDLMVDGVTGFLVPMGNVTDLTAKLEWLAEHPQERRDMGAAGRKRIEETFALDKVLPQMRIIYQNELERKTR